MAKRHLIERKTELQRKFRTVGRCPADEEKSVHKERNVGMLYKYDFILRYFVFRVRTFG